MVGDKMKGGAKKWRKSDGYGNMGGDILKWDKGLEEQMMK